MNRPATAEEKRQQQENTTVNQGFVKDEDLIDDEEAAELMSSGEVEAYAQKAASANQDKTDKLKGEGDYKAAESYDQAATEFAQKHQDKR